MGLGEEIAGKEALVDSKNAPLLLKNVLVLGI